jgi:hypothetical protein
MLSIKKILGLDKLLRQLTDQVAELDKKLILRLEATPISTNAETIENHPRLPIVEEQPISVSPNKSPQKTTRSKASKYRSQTTISETPKIIKEEKPVSVMPILPQSHARNKKPSVAPIIVETPIPVETPITNVLKLPQIPMKTIPKPNYVANKKGSKTVSTLSKSPEVTIEKTIKKSKSSQ